MKFAYVVIVCGGAVALSAGSANAQLECNALLSQGIKNIEITKSADASLATKYFNNCGKDYHSMDQNELIQATVEVYGYGSGGGTFDREAAERNLQQWCTTNKEAAESHRDLYQESQTIYSDALTAWSNCNALAARQVTFETAVNGDNTIVDLSLYYTGPGSSGVEFYDAEGDGFTCDTRYPTKAANAQDQINTGRPYLLNTSKTGPIEIDRQAIEIKCKRAPPQTETQDGEQVVVQSEGTISVRTASGKPIQLYFPATFNPPLPVQAANALKKSIDSLTAQFTQTSGQLQQELQQANATIGDLQTKLKDGAVPSDTIAAFNLPGCPTGWDDKTKDGNLIMPNSGTILAASQGGEKMGLADERSTNVMISGGGNGQLTVKAYRFCIKK
jgi:hypothetical protein